MASPLLTEEVLEDADYPITAEDLGLDAKDDNVRLFNWVIAAHRLIVAAPECFEDSVLFSELIGPHTGEDWHWAFQIMNHHHGAMVKAAWNDGRSTGSRNKTNRPATVIRYRNRGGDRTLSMSQEAEAARLGDELSEAHAVFDSDTVLPARYPPSMTHTSPAQG